MLQLQSYRQPVVYYKQGSSKGSAPLRCLPVLSENPGESDERSNTSF